MYILPSNQTMFLSPKAIMQVIAQAFILFIAIGQAWLSPLENRNPTKNLNLYQGDMLLSEERNAVPTDKKLWPGGVIPYKISEGLVDIVPHIEFAMQHIMNRTCIKFVPWDGKAKDYVDIISDKECYSHWGRQGTGAQSLSLGYGCENVNTIIHELMHSIGFDHEHNRSDRDKYLIIFWQNIWPDGLDQFNTHKPRENRLITEFDYNSIMQYGEKTFSKDGWSKTMKSRYKGYKVRPVNEKKGLSKLDVQKINILYKCDINLE